MRALHSIEALRIAKRRYEEKHYAVIRIRREHYAKLKAAAEMTGLSVVDFVTELFKRYGERLAREMAEAAEAKAKPSAQPSRPAGPRPTAKSLTDFMKSLVVEVGGRSFVLPEWAWRALESLAKGFARPDLEAHLSAAPREMKDLVKAMIDAGALYYDGSRWRIDYGAVRVRALG